MNRSLSFRIAFLSAAALLALAPPAEAGRARGPVVLDQDLLLLPYIEQDNLYRLTYYRGTFGSALLRTESQTLPARVTPLGFTPPIGSNKGSYVATPDGSAWAAFSSSQRIRVFDLGDLEQPGAIDALLVDVILAPSTFDPGRTELGIIAILIGLVAEERPGLSVTAVSDGTSNTIMLGWTGTSFEPVVDNGDGTWSFSIDIGTSETLMEEEGILYF